MICRLVSLRDEGVFRCGEIACQAESLCEYHRAAAAQWLRLLQSSTSLDVDRAVTRLARAGLEDAIYDEGIIAAEG